MVRETKLYDSLGKFALTYPTMPGLSRLAAAHMGSSADKKGRHIIHRDAR